MENIISEMPSEAIEFEIQGIDLSISIREEKLKSIRSSLIVRYGQKSLPVKIRRDWEERAKNLEAEIEELYSARSEYYEELNRSIN